VSSITFATASSLPLLMVCVAPNCLALSSRESASDDQVVFLADILPTAFEVGVVAGAVKPGDTVAIVGAGPIGLATILTAGLARLDNRAHSLVAEHGSRLAGGHVALEDVQVRAADRGRVDLHNRVSRVLDPGVWHLLPGTLPGTLVDERFHGRLLSIEVGLRVPALSGC
jgi:hypothetical protein